MAITLGDAIPAADGTDFKVLHGAKTWRARVREAHRIATNAPVNGTGKVAPSGTGLSVSVALLTASGAVSKNAAGELMIFDAAIITVQKEALANPAVKVADMILATIEDRIADAEAQIAGKREYAVALAPWLTIAPEPVKVTV